MSRDRDGHSRRTFIQGVGAGALARGAGATGLRLLGPGVADLAAIKIIKKRA